MRQFVATSGTVYTAPAGHRVIVKWYQALNRDTIARAVGLRTVPAGGGAVIFAVNDALAPNAVLGGSCWFVLEAGDTLDTSSNSPDLSILASGAVLIV